MELHSQEITEIAMALAKVQSVLEGAKKTSANPFHKSKYADLSEVWDRLKDILPENGLSVSQLMIPLDGRDYLMTFLMHKSGQWLKSYAPIIIQTITSKAKDGSETVNTKMDSQGIGSAMTYMRRYSLCAMIGVVQEDDDGNAATFISRKQNQDLIGMLKGHPDIYSHLMTQLSKAGIGSTEKIPIVDYEKIYVMVAGWVKKKTEKLEENNDEGEE